MADANNDPTFLAYMRALGFDDAQAKADADLAAQKAQAQYNVQQPELEHRGEVERQGIGEGWEDRGLFRSSGSIRDIADQRHDQAYQQGLLDLGLATNISDLQQKLMESTMGNQQKLADQELLGWGRQYLQEGLAPLGG